MELFQESSLNDSIIFQHFNKQSEFMTIINSCIKNGMILDESFIQEQIIQIKRTRISPLADHVLQAYDNGDIILVYSKTTRVPQAVPFIVLKIQGTLKAFVFVNNYGTISKNEKAGGDQYLNMPMKDLYVLMEGAYTALNYYRYPVQITKNLGLMKLCANIYSNMLLRILNKECSLSTDRDLYNQVSFCLAKFFLDRVWESKNDDINTAYAISSLLNPNKAELLILNDNYKSANIQNIEDLIKFIKSLSPRLDLINFRLITGYYINMFKQSAIFSMECLPYFLYVIEASMIGSFVVNNTIVRDIVKNIKGINTFYAELAKVL